MHYFRDGFVGILKKPPFSPFGEFNSESWGTRQSLVIKATLSSGFQIHWLISKQNKIWKRHKRVNVDLLRENEKAVPRVGGAPREGDCYVACPVSFLARTGRNLVDTQVLFIELSHIFFFLSLGPTNRASTALLVGGPTQSEEWPCVLMIHHSFAREFAPSSKWNIFHAFFWKNNLVSSGPALS